VRTMLEDTGGLWIGTTVGLHRTDARGKAPPWPVEGRSLGRVSAIVRDARGTLWIGAGNDLVAWRPDEGPLRPQDRLQTGAAAAPARAGEAFRFRGGAGEVDALFVSSRNEVWIGARETNFALYDGQAFRTYPAPLGTLHVSPIAFGEDDAGNVWVGTAASGAVKIARSGFVTYDHADGMGGDWVVSLFEDTRGALYVVTRTGYVNRLDGDRFEAVRPNVPLDIATAPLGRTELVLPAADGDWWVRSRQGAFRFAPAASLDALATARPTARYTTRDGLPSDHVSRLYHDARGDVWIGTYPGPDGRVLTRWERSSGRLLPQPLPPRDRPWSAPLAFCEDGSGGLWISHLEGGLVRVRDGQAEALDLLPPRTLVIAMYRDRAGRMWLAAEQSGLVRIDDPGARHPLARVYTKAQGLSSDNVTSVTEDRWGRIYVGTQAGVDRLDPQNDRIKHFTTADGLAQNEVKNAYRDRQDRLWFGTLQGLSRLVPEPDAEPRAPRVRISGVRVAGRMRPLSALGESQVTGVVLEPDANQLQIEFASIGLAAGEILRYQYRLGDDRAWSAPTRERSVQFAGLPAGRHRFLVRAVNADGLPSQEPAAVSFRVRAPVWRRWWFLSGAAALGGLLAYAFFRYRVNALVEVERVRTAIATDLHDDIGSSLSKIAILSEVARREEGASTAGGRLVTIADISRELVDSMSDIVWAVNPRRDSLRDLSQRMRSFAAEMFSAMGVELSFQGPDPEGRVPLGAELRRQAFLIFKEAVSNAARHAQCRRVDVSLRIDDDELTLAVADDGQGFDNADGDGHGLDTMAARARALGGWLDVLSRPDQGTTVSLRAPLRRRRLRATRSRSDSGSRTA
jgi:signal transduction histidine kinase/ligand-binding sensor domain-containing protein